MITTVIFDMNGVITDDEECHELATKRAFEQVGLDVTPEIYRRFCLGRTDLAAFKELIEIYSLYHVKLERIIADKTKIYLELIRHELKIYPEVVDLIDRLYKNYTLALTTSSTLSEAQTVIIKLRLQDKFRIVVTSEDVVYGKPHPEPYLLTAKKLGVDPKACLVIEDSENGVRSAKAAGMKCVAITNSEKRDKLMLADHIVDRFSEITDEFIRQIPN
ncbi:HAD family phosphatase [Flavobacteriaceae bacterium F89]|uniref:HAD family phosphatase n=1 Tax=Cerina litoralis TaxID=2874477 RepID=A0AAE3ESJ8_9FLAO|nr:HAD family phosphatase [Cerina litoralis]MCG2460422.1 HAD family phosphatase [Cerina litoralis]